MTQVARTNVACLAGALAIATAGRLYAGILTSDDAYITFRYATNLAAHHQLVYNLGERVLGTSTPLFALILGVAAAAHLPLNITAFALSLLSDLVSVSLVFLLLADAGEILAARVAVLPLAALPAFLTSTVTGMETPVYTALLLLAVVATAGERAGFAGVLLGLTAICRPDGVLLAFVALGVLMVRRRYRPLVRMAAVALLTVTPWLLFATWYYGSPVPQSVVAKAAGEGFTLEGLSTLRGYLLGGSYLPLSLLAVLGAHRLWVRGAPAWRIVIPWWVLYTSAFATTGAFARAEWYFPPLLPAYFAFVAAGLVRVLDLRWLAPLRLPAAVAVVAVLTAAPVAHWPRHRAALRHVRAIREQTYMTIAGRIAASAHPCDVAAGEIGALGFAFPGRIIDLGGLVTPEAVRLSPAALLRQTNAQWLVIQNIYLPASVPQDRWFAASFHLVSSIWIEPGRTTNVYERIESACPQSQR
jgi:hypothetical protein